MHVKCVGVTASDDLGDKNKLNKMNQTQDAVGLSVG